jgi:hypothetical protein
VMGRGEGPWRITKEYRLGMDAPELAVRYTLGGMKGLWFGAEFCLSLLAGNDPSRYFEIPGAGLEDRSLASRGQSEGVKELRMVDEWLKLDVCLSFSEPASLIRFPIETVSQSESGIERTYQGSVMLALFKVVEDEVELSISLKVENH